MSATEYFSKTKKLFESTTVVEQPVEEAPAPARDDVQSAIMNHTKELMDDFVMRMDRLAKEISNEYYKDPEYVHQEVTAAVKREIGERKLLGDKVDEYGDEGRLY
jgi:hypothetical protein